MKREIDSLIYLENSINFFELVYYNGPKLSVNMEKQYILAWNKEFDEYETWFLIKPSTAYFNEYISGHITLLEIMKNSKVELIHRDYNNYETLNISELEPDLDMYNLPGKVSFLGFDFKSEYNYGLLMSKQVKNYSIYEVTVDTNNIVILPSANIWGTYRSNASRYVKREQYVA
ncbi:hypothetical protein KKC34_12335 [bacterium]|nr:hypothetical protein [bacterium]